MAQYATYSQLPNYANQQQQQHPQQPQPQQQQYAYPVQPPLPAPQAPRLFGEPCPCGLPSVILTVKKQGPTMGRQFMACQRPKNEQCHFFKWVKRGFVPAPPSPFHPLAVQQNTTEDADDQEETQEPTPPRPKRAKFEKAPPPPMPVLPVGFSHAPPTVPGYQAGSTEGVTLSMIYEKVNMLFHQQSEIAAVLDKQNYHIIALEKVVIKSGLKSYSKTDFAWQDPLVADQLSFAIGDAKAFDESSYSMAGPPDAKAFGESEKKAISQASKQMETEAKRNN